MISEKLWQEYLQKTKHFVRHYTIDESHQRFICNLISNLPIGATVVELGVCNGSTAGLIVLSGQKNQIDYYGIDNFSLENHYYQVNQALSLLKAPYHLIEADTRKYPWSKPIDLLLIDAGHDEANVSKDCPKWIPLVKKGGYVVFHDWPNTSDHSHCHWAVRHYGELQTQGWQQIAYLTELLMVKRNLTSEQK